MPKPTRWLLPFLPVQQAGLPLLAALGISVGLVAQFPQPARSQALLPRILELDGDQMTRQGLSLAQEAAQLAQLQQFQMALPRAELAAQLAPRNFQVWALLGSLYIQAQRLDDGIAALKQAQSLNTKEAAVLFALGTAHFQKQKYQEAANYIQAGLKLRPNTPGALFDLGNAYYMMQRYQDALAQYEKTVRQDAKFWPAINNIGLVDYELGRVDAALKQWQKAADLEADAAEPRLALAIVLYSRGDQEKGLALGEAALKIDRRYAEVAFLKENLWGDKLLAEAKKFLAIPRIQTAIAQLKEQAADASR